MYGSGTLASTSRSALYSMDVSCPTAFWLDGGRELRFRFHTARIRFASAEFDVNAHRRSAQKFVRPGSMDGSLHASGVMNRWLSIVRTAEIAVILGSAIVIVASLGQQIWKTRQARRDLHTLGRLGHFNWTMDHEKRCPPDAAAIARHMGCGRTVDPWGTPYQLACSEDEPREKGHTS